MTTPTDAELRALAEAALASKPENDDTPWPWVLTDPIEGLDLPIREGNGGGEDDPWLVPFTDPQADFMDVAHPRAILALLDGKAAAERERDLYLRTLETNGEQDAREIKALNATIESKDHAIAENNEFYRKVIEQRDSIIAALRTSLTRAEAALRDVVRWHDQCVAPNFCPVCASARAALGDEDVHGLHRASPDEVSQ